MTFIAREPKKINIRLIRKGKSYEAEEVLRRLRSFLDRNEAEPVKILRGFWKDQQDALSYGEIREAILAGHISEQTIKEWRQDYAKLVNEQFSHTWKNALAVGYKGQPIIDNLSSFHFDMQKPGVLSWIGERGAEFVTNESQTTKDAIRGLLMRSVTEKHSVDELSRVIRPLVGLNKPQAYANMRYYENVINTLSDQHPRTSKEVIQRRAQEAAWKYAEKQHRERAYMIARTEMSFAYNRGAYEGIKQAQELGLMGAVVKIWSTSQGGNVCPDCEALEGEEVGMEDTWGDKFPSRGLFRGDNLVPPLHPRCECAIVYQEVSTKDVGGLKPAYSYDEYDVPEEGFVYDEYKPNEKPVYVDRTGVKSDGTRAYESDLNRTQQNVDNKENAAVAGLEGAASKPPPRLARYIPDNEKRLEIIQKGIELEKPIFTDDPVGILAQGMPPENGMYTVVLHGHAYYVEFFGQPIDAETLCAIIAQRKDYKKGMPIRLISCYTGSKEDGVAQYIANKLGAVVWAPDKQGIIRLCFGHYNVYSGSLIGKHDGAFIPFEPNLKKG